MSTELIRLLRRLWPIALCATAMGAASGIATAALLDVTNRALHEGATAIPALLWRFVGLCALALVGEIISDIGNNLVGQRVIASLRRDLSAKVLQAPIAQIEQFRSHRLVTALNQDIDTISAFSFLFSSLAIATTTVAACLVYLFILSPLMLGVAAIAILVGTIVQAVARRIGINRFVEAREAEDRLQKHYRAITEGAKELRINRRRRERVFNDDLSGTIGAILKLRVRAANIFVSANAFGSLLFFAVVGVMLTLQLWEPDADRTVITGFVLVLLYMKGPIQEMLGVLPSIGRAQIALQRITALSARFSTAEPALLKPAEDGTADELTDKVTDEAADEARDDAAVLAASFQSITLANVQYRFDRSFEERLPDARSADADDDADGIATPITDFVLGPMSLTIRRGETLFIVGENGCGKTTLIKLLLGLYTPTQGELLIDGVPVDAVRRDPYRQLFSAVFSDYHLFETLVPGEDVVNAEAQRYLERLGIAHKVAIRNGAFTTTDLSTGQRKRLALVHAYLEDRPIIVLDEWAADQDPTFRRIFYAEILPDLKRQGKTLIVISHDDRYFSAADRYIRLDDGKVVEDVRNDVTTRGLPRSPSAQPY